MKTKLLKTNLHNIHKNILNCNLFAEFAGYEMPITYKNLGIIKESNLCRSNASMFDIGHMGQMRYFFLNTL